MNSFLDDRMFVLCLGRFNGERVLDSDNRIVSQSFSNIKNYSFYTESGIVKDGEYFFNSMVQYESKESLANLQQGQQYAVLIFHNTAGYPPHKQLIFETLDEVIQCIREQLAMVPLVSLEGKPPQFKTSDEYREYIEQYGMVEFFI